MANFATAIRGLTLAGFGAAAILGAGAPGPALGQAPHSAAATGVPPGLAKKGGLPPGQAKKAYRRGDHLDGGYVVISRPDRYRLPPLRPGEIYVRTDDQVLRVVEATLLVAAAVGAVSDLLN